MWRWKRLFGERQSFVLERGVDQRLDRASIRTNNICILFDQIIG